VDNKGLLRREKQNPGKIGGEGKWARKDVKQEEGQSSVPESRESLKKLKKKKKTSGKEENRSFQSTGKEHFQVSHNIGEKRREKQRKGGRNNSRRERLHDHFAPSTEVGRSPVRGQKVKGGGGGFQSDDRESGSPSSLYPEMNSVETGKEGGRETVGKLQKGVRSPPILQRHLLSARSREKNRYDQWGRT